MRREETLNLKYLKPTKLRMEFTAIAIKVNNIP